MNDIMAFLPFGLTLLLAILVLMLEVFMTKNKEIIGYISLGGVVLGILGIITYWNSQPQPFRISYFRDMFVVDNYSLFFYILFLFCAAVTILTSMSYLKRENMEHGEYYALILFSVTGMMLMASGGDLITLFLGLEIMSISIYVLVGFNRRDMKANEAILKYFFLGAFSSGFILYGIALLFGTTGSTSLYEINQFITINFSSNASLLMIGVLLLIVGASFKVAAVPFHGWAPDVYDGASSPVTGFMITAVKAASFALFLKIFLVGLVELNDDWNKVIVFLSVITMFIGNIFAFTQNNIKRMLAYSSIAHTGYLLIGIAALSNSPSNQAGDAILYYLVAYSIASLGIFACISFLSQKDEKYINIDDYAGVGFKYPVIGFTITILMLSLIGIPPTGGFFGKYYLFLAAMKEEMFWLVIIAIINSIMSVYYYLRVIAVMYAKEQIHEFSTEDGKFSTNLVLVYTSVLTLWVGIGSYTFFAIIPGASDMVQWAKISIQSLF